MRNEFDDQPAKYHLNGATAGFPEISGNEILNIDQDPWMCLLTLGIMVLIYRIIAYVILEKVHTGKK